MWASDVLKTHIYVQKLSVLHSYRSNKKMYNMNPFITIHSMPELGSVHWINDLQVCRSETIECEIYISAENTQKCLLWIPKRVYDDVMKISAHLHRSYFTSVCIHVENQENSSVYKQHLLIYVLAHETDKSNRVLTSIFQAVWPNLQLFKKHWTRC